MKVIIVIRENHEGGGSGLSEEERCLSYAEARQWIRVGVYKPDVHKLDGQADGAWEPLGRQLAQTRAAAVLAADLSRVTDNMQQFILFLRMLKRHKVKLYTVKDGEVVNFS